MFVAAENNNRTSGDDDGGDVIFTSTSEAEADEVRKNGYREAMLQKAQKVHIQQTPLKSSSQIQQLLFNVFLVVLFSLLVTPNSVNAYSGNSFSNVKFLKLKKPFFTRS